MAFVGVVAVGQTLLMIAGEFDLSVGSVAGLTSYIAAALMAERDLPVFLSVLIALGIGALIGVVNGLVVVRLHVPSFVATIGMLYIAAGLTTTISQGRYVRDLPAEFTSFGLATPLGLSWAFFILIALVIAAELFLRRTVAGRSVYAVGGDPNTARLLSVDPGIVKVALFALVGTLAALGGVLLIAKTGAGSAQTGTGWELLVVGAVVIGGTSLWGGAGTVVGTLLGLMIMQTVTQGLVLSGLASYWQTIAVGVLVMASMGVELARRRFLGEWTPAPARAAET
jgi:ribose transport system permease protein